MIGLKKYTHIIWDWNGTLLNDAWLCVEVMNGMLTERGLPLKTIDAYKELFDFPVRDYYEKLGWDFSIDPFDIVGMEFIVRYNRRQHETRLHAEAASTLARFREMGYRQLILSAREQNELLSEANALGVSEYFDRICGLDDHYAHGKTDVGRRLVDELDVPKDKLLFIGDTRHDAEVAGEIGIDCILIPNGHHSLSRLMKLGVPIISSLEELTRSL